MKNKMMLGLVVALFSFTFMSADLKADGHGMKVTSKSFKEGETLSMDHVFKGFGCEGKNISPELSWSGAPDGTKSFVITAYDPDAPTGSGWWHWTAFNIPADVMSIPEGASLTDKMPAGAIEGKTDYAANGFGGACPPKGDDPHRYIFTVYAMPDEKLPIDENAPGAMVGYFVNAQSLAKGQITGMYGH